MTSSSGYYEPDREPDILIGGLSVWVHGREIADATNETDADWLRVAARYKGEGSSVRIAGPILMSSDLAWWSDQLKGLDTTLSGEAALDSYEPNLKVRCWAAGSAGRMMMRVEMSPDGFSEGHWFEEGLDQSYLKPLVASIERVLVTYPPHRKRAS